MAQKRRDKGMRLFSVSGSLTIKQSDELRRAGLCQTVREPPGEAKPEKGKQKRWFIDEFILSISYNKRPEPTTNVTDLQQTGKL